MSDKDRSDLEAARRVMGALLRMPPKPHDEMKVGKKPKPKKSQSPATKRAKKASGYAVR
jgi:hypothetical protein